MHKVILIIIKKFSSSLQPPLPFELPPTIYVTISVFLFILFYFYYYFFLVYSIIRDTFVHI